jgi:hypothetical protein
MSAVHREAARGLTEEPDYFAGVPWAAASENLRGDVGRHRPNAVLPRCSDHLQPTRSRVTVKPVSKPQVVDIQQIRLIFSI